MDRLTDEQLDAVEHAAKIPFEHNYQQFRQYAGLARPETVLALIAEVRDARARIAALEQAVRAVEWAGDPGTDPNSFVCPFCGRAHFENETSREHAAGCIVRTLPEVPRA